MEIGEDWETHQTMSAKYVDSMQKIETVNLTRGADSGMLIFVTA